jgi:hypothetical protein
VSDVQEAIDIVRHSQDTHRQWLEWIEWHEENDCECPYEEILETAGDKEHQRSRIDRYQLVLDVLENINGA